MEVQSKKGYPSFPHCNFLLDLLAEYFYSLIFLFLDLSAAFCPLDLGIAEPVSKIFIAMGISMVNTAAGIIISNE